MDGMASKNETGSRPAVITAYLAAHPTHRFRPVQVAEATGYATHQAASTLIYLSRQGRVRRFYDHKHKRSTYGYAPPVEVSS